MGDAANLTRGPLTRTITTAYNADSEVVSVIDPASTNTFTRDNLGRATTVATTLASGNSASLAQSFDSAGNRTELRSTLGTTADFKNTYTYDKLRRLTDVVQTSQTGGFAVTPKHVAFGYNALSQRTQIARYQSTGTTNAVATSNFTYDYANRLEGIAHKQGATNLNTYAYVYAPLSRLSSVNSTAEGLTSYSYNVTSQLTGATNTGTANETYGYDANGNRNTTGYTFMPVDNRTTASPAVLGSASVPAYSYVYDAEGNMTSRSDANGTTTFKYDNRNRLIQVLDSDIPGGSLNYQYDAFNRLVARNDFVSFQNWVYDEGINPVYQFDNSTSGINLSHRFVWSNMVDELLADEEVNSLVSGGNTLWALSDHLGSIRDIADVNEGTGATTVVNHRRYNAFGRRTSQSGAVDLIFGYAGKQFDEVTRLQLHLNRWYDPNLGKWISQDPIGFAGGDANLYRYAGNGPTNAKDPFGLASGDEWDSWNPGVWAGNWSGGVYGWWAYGGSNVKADVAIRLLEKNRTLNNVMTADLKRYGNSSRMGETERQFVEGMVNTNYQFQAMAAGMASPVGVVRGVGTNPSVAPAKALRYKLNPITDLDWRGLSKTVDDALGEAFKRTGQNRVDFKVVKWGKDKHGKSVPVMWRGPNKAEVNIDWPHYGVDRHGNWVSGPDAPHVGWQFGKGSDKSVGHIILDDVSYNR